MVSGGPPSALNHRHLLIALMLAAGWRQRDIAAKLGYNENRVSIICQSPLLRAQVDRLQRELRESTVADVVHRIATEAGPSLDVMVELRDTAQETSVRLAAAKDILDRNPRLARVSRLEEDRHVRITFGAPELRQMFGALLEIEGKPVPRVLDVTPRGGGSTDAGSRGDGKVGARSLDEAIEAREAAVDVDG